MTKLDLIQQILKMKPDYAKRVNRLFALKKIELEVIYDKLKAGVTSDPIGNIKIMIVKQIDACNRIIIPTPLRKLLGVDPGDYVTLETCAPNKIIISKVQPEENKK